ncbi:MAG: serpin family protein [Anaerolineales bacterium]
MKIITNLQKTTLLLAAGLFTLVMTGCAILNSTLPDTGKAQVLESNKPRVDIGNIPPTDLKKLAEGNTSFALDLYHKLQSNTGNLFYSPYSLSAALAMTYAGAEGGTAEEMAAVLKFLLPQEGLHPAFNALDQKLTDLAEIEIPEGQGDPFQLNIANAIWGQKDFHFEEDFLDILAENYGAGLRLLDFISKPEDSRVTINQWVSDETKEKIQDLIPQGGITSDTRMVLSNAIYFKATWSKTFMQNRTEEGIFYGLDGEEISTQMMKTGTDASFRYFLGEGYQAVELPYTGNQASMLVIVPDRGNFEEFENQLSSNTLNQILNSLAYSPVALTFPKFEFESEISLAQILAEMGMPTAFSDTADFSGMIGSKELFISDVFHKAFVSVDEEGTEAAAATAMEMATSAMPESPIELTVDRPFLFLIWTQETDTILFIGRVVSP